MSSYWDAARKLANEVEWCFKTKERAPSSVFHLDVERMRQGWYTDTYFNRTRHLVTKHRPGTKVLMQVFQKNHAVLGGIDEAIAIIRECSGGHSGPGPAQDLDAAIRQWDQGWDQLTVHALYEGDDISPYEPVLTIEGPYRLFAHLETVYLGVLARRTLVGTNVRRVCEAANGKPVMFFPARHDDWRQQTGDGYAAHHAGAVGVSTDAQSSWWGGKGQGTIPHALIAAWEGDTVGAAVVYAEEYGEIAPVSVLVDFENNCAETAVAVAKSFRDRGLKLGSVRLDTSGTMVDYDLIRKGLGQFKPTGVVPELVWRVRQRLDDHGFQDVQIGVSGGFAVDKIRQFEAQSVPVDYYGVGSSLLRGENDFTADIVRVNGRPCAKVGRREQPSDRLEVVR